MCGIAGFNFNDKSKLEKMTNALRHRGPDDSGYYMDDIISLGHRRLSIIDISEKGHQPMQFENLVLVYNGEIYNFKEIRKQLKSDGYSFASDSDSEVVLYSYHKWGSSCVEKFNGMWSFCVYDKDNGSLFLSRDRFGIKPLYYYFDGDRFIFASELKAIREHDLSLRINKEAVNFFFYQKYIGGDRTIFENCFKVRPSENILFDLQSKKLTQMKYYDLEVEISRYQNQPISERLGTIESVIVEAVQKRLVADVPVGSFLSGGVDSSLISAIISKNHKNFDTFSIGFKDKSYDEVGYSKMASEHIETNHHYEYMDMNPDMMKQIIEMMDEPFGDSSILPTYLLSKITRQKVTVSLSGDAGDEVFGGYDTYKGYKIARYIPIPIARLLKHVVNLFHPSDKKVTLAFKIKRFVRDFDRNVNRRHLDWMATFNDTQRQKLLNDNFITAKSLINCSDEKSLRSIQLNDISNYLAEDILKKVDLASMLNSLETRVPFLDHELVPLVLSLPEKYKISGFKTKYFLKKIASDYLPRQIVHRQKRGFTVPISKWIKNSDLIKSFITDKKYFDHGFLNYNYIQELVKDHANKNKDNARELWLIFIFNYWVSKRYSTTTA